MASLPDNRGFDYFLPGGEPLPAVAGNSSAVGFDYFEPGGEPLEALVEVASVAPSTSGFVIGGGVGGATGGYVIGG